MQASCNEDAPAMYNVSPRENRSLALAYALFNIYVCVIGLRVIGLLVYGIALLSSDGVLLY
jgi:hypothetical protein